MGVSKIGTSCGTIESSQMTIDRRQHTTPYARTKVTRIKLYKCCSTGAHGFLQCSSCTHQEPFFFRLVKLAQLGGERMATTLTWRHICWAGFHDRRWADLHDCCCWTDLHHRNGVCPLTAGCGLERGGGSCGWRAEEDLVWTNTREGSRKLLRGYLLDLPRGSS